MDLLSIHGSVLPVIGHYNHWFMEYSGLPNGTIFHYMIFGKVTLAIITTDYIGKVFKY